MRLQLEGILTRGGKSPLELLDDGDAGTAADALGACLGKEYRAVAALLDAGFAKRLQELLKEQG